LSNNNKNNISNQLFELLELAVRYGNQQVRALVEKNVTAPIKSAGIILARTIITAVILAMATIFITVGLFLLLVKLVGSTWLAFLLVGAVLLFGAFFTTVFKKDKSGS